MLACNSSATGIRIYTVIRTRSFSVQSHAETYRFAIHRWTQDKMQVAGMKAKYECSIRAGCNCLLAFNSPIAAQCPFIQLQGCGCGVGLGLVMRGAPG